MDRHSNIIAGPVYPARVPSPVVFFSASQCKRAQLFIFASPPLDDPDMTPPIEPRTQKT